MKLAEALTVLYWVFGVVWCREFSVTLPDRVEAVRGLCVLVPCAFEIGSGYEERFKRNLKGLWRKDGPDSHTVFDSTTPETNLIKGEIRGDLSMKNCTTLFYSVRSADSGRYYFRIEGEDKYTYSNPSVYINISDSPPKPSVYVGQTEVEDRRLLEGSSVSLICSALAPCPSNPPTLTWSPLPLNSIQEQNQTTSFISSHLSFTASHLHHGLRINCSATYRLEKNMSRRAQRGVVLHVEYPPRNTTVSVSPSGPVLLGGSVSLSCSSDGNPAVLNYTWYRENGEQIETGDTLTITETDDTHSGLYYCRAENQHGTQSSSVQLDVQYVPQVSFIHLPSLILTALLLLSVAVNGFLLYKLKQLSTKTQALKVDGDTYASLQLSAQDSDYETLQPNRGRRLEWTLLNRDMKLAETLTVLYWVFGVVWCREFSVTLPDRVEAVRGLCVLVPCAFEIGSGYEEKFKRNLKGLWRKDGPEDSHTVFDSTTPETNQIKGEIRGDLRMKNCTTLFYSVRTADSGRYYFRIEGEDKMTFRESSVDISVSDPKPTLSVYVGQTEVEDRRLLEGSSVSLICSALAPCPSNPPTLTWSPLPLNSIQEQNKTTSFISSHLSFTASHLHHRLRINCSATYRLENYISRRAQRGVVLHVEYPPRNTTVSVSPSGPVLLGGSVSLSCSSDGNPAVLNYTWYRENGEQIETGDTLTITETDDTHSGLYYCRAENQHGTQSSSVQLDVQYPPRNTTVSVSPSGPVLLGGSVSLSCSSDGNPAVLNYTWYRENGEQIETGDTLTITETDDTHSGLYYCRAENQHGTQSSSVQLDVQYPPRNTTVSVSPSGPVLLGGSVSLSCSSDGNPAVLNYTWYRENGEQIETGDTLTITETDDTHSGLYYCRAENQHGTQSSSVRLDVQYVPQVSFIHLPSLILTALLLLSVAVNGFLLYKLKQLSTKTQALKVDGDTYASMQLSAQDSDYENLQPNRGRRLEQDKA
ncbi:hemicentin-2-like [Salminus brasiliensis]|uniref:hemicentin-2-like n=1 Tax=Salminus brasiliensis TaxID=930266 RepID=UPI003B83A3E6